MDGKETAKRKQVLEGNAFYEIDLECMRTVSYTHLTLPTIA